MYIINKFTVLIAVLNSYFFVAQSHDPQATFVTRKINMVSLQPLNQLTIIGRG